MHISTEKDNALVLGWNYVIDWVWLAGKREKVQRFLMVNCSVLSFCLLQARSACWMAGDGTVLGLVDTEVNSVILVG